MQVNIGISEPIRTRIGEELNKVLADTYTLYLLTHNFHWNVTGPMFQTLHTMFETEYNELALAVDQIAERIRALGLPSPGTYADFARLTAIKEPVGVPPARQMIQILVDAHETTIRTLRTAFPVANDVNDAASADLITQRLNIHEKTAWMLRSMTEG